MRGRQANENVLPAPLVAMRIGVPKESTPDERRVALVPVVLPSLIKAGLEIVVESGAGLAAGLVDDDFKNKGATIGSRDDAFAADVVAQVRCLGATPEPLADINRMQSGKIWIGTCEPLAQPQPIQEAASRGATVLSLELVPRITRAQSMDVLSSMAMLAGYKAVLLAATTLPKMFPMMITAAGTVSPARVFVIGAGVAGLQAISTAKRLGAVVEAYDVRPAVKEQVESLGASFVEMELETEDAQDAGGYAREQGEEFLNKQREFMTRVIAGSDVVITTAAIPGKKAPLLVTRAMVEAMRRGSIVVDLAAESGGNCEVTQAGKTVDHQGVTVLGPENITSTLPRDASQLIAKNIATFLLHLTEEGEVRIDAEDEITRGTLVAYNGEVVHARVREALGLPALEPAADKAS